MSVKVTHILLMSCVFCLTKFFPSFNDMCKKNVFKKFLVYSTINFAICLHFVLSMPVIII